MDSIKQKLREAVSLQLFKSKKEYKEAKRKE